MSSSASLVEDSEHDQRDLCSVLQHNPWSLYLGDCPVVTSYLRDKPLLSPVWSPLHILNIFLRAVGQVRSRTGVVAVVVMLLLQPAFVNNPLLGAVILAGLFLYEVEVGAGCALGGLAATTADLALGLHPPADLHSGVAAFNGVLVGTVIPILFPAFYPALGRSPAMWAAVALGAVTSVFVARAFGNLLSKFDVPYMALPFNLIAVCIFLTLQPVQLGRDLLTAEAEATTVSPELYENETLASANVSLSWEQVGRGVVVSMGQVYAVSEVEPSIVINLAVLLSSPLLFLVSSLGAALASLLSLAFLEPTEYETIYSGLWGYNGLLAMAAASCVFFPLTLHSFVTGLVNVAATVFVQRALQRNMDTVQEATTTIFFQYIGSIDKLRDYVISWWHQGGQ